MQVCCRC